MIKCSIKKEQNPIDKKLNFAKIIKLKNQIIFYITPKKIGSKQSSSIKPIVIHYGHILKNLKNKILKFIEKKVNYKMSNLI
ncbi:hypothetical protein BpHYR1_003369 [Brachionus plicatilis]|uniref:Uncharacterized protein n=1 Tax=Brachionus plicatilis TaxID=10195 RepID=A0A3M7SJ10_BRAPC|nr:hypothetical protein BpHYR1_003369 [Brachionus plicatilis]